MLTALGPQLQVLGLLPSTNLPTRIMSTSNETHIWPVSEERLLHAHCWRGFPTIGCYQATLCKLELRASPTQGPVLPATATAGTSEPEFGPTPSVPFPLVRGSCLVRGSRQESSRSRQIFRVCREH